MLQSTWRNAGARRMPRLNAHRALLTLCLLALGSVATHAETVSVSYSYDNLNRLEEATYASIGTVSYAYDPARGITSRSAAEPDADGDGVSDASDNCPNTANANQANTDNDAQGNACDADDDNDNLDDSAEAGLGTDPLNPDSDGDRLNDGDEVAAGTGPLDPDSDDDGFDDGEEVDSGSNPLSANDQPTPNGISIIVIKAAIDKQSE